MNVRKHRWTSTAWGVLALVVLASPAIAQPVGVRIVEEDFRFTEETDITVDVFLSDVEAVAGVDLVLIYPVERFVSTPTWETGGLFGFISANTESTPGRVVVAAAAAEGLGVTDGSLLTLTFKVPCEGNDVPGGSDVTFSFEEFLAWDELSQPLAASAPDDVVTLLCEPVAVDRLSFGMVKAFFGPDDR